MRAFFKTAGISLFLATILAPSAFAGEDLGLYEAQKHYTIGCDRVMYDHCSEFDSDAVWREFEPEFYQFKRELQAAGSFPLEKAWSGEKKFGKLIANITLHYTYAKSANVKRSSIADKSIAQLELVDKGDDEVAITFTMADETKFNLRTYPTQAKQISNVFACKDKEGWDRKGVCADTPRSMVIFFHEPTREILRVDL